MVVAIVLFIGVAVVKPWDFGVPHGPLPTSAADRRSPAPSPSDEPVASSEPSIPTEPVLPDDATVAAAWSGLEERSAWGFQVIAASSVANAIETAWLPGLDLPVPFQGAVLAIGLTAPTDDPVLDLRIWGGADRSRVSVARVQAAPQTTAGYRYVDEESGSVAAWPAGVYDVDILTATSVRSARFSIPGHVDPPSFNDRGPVAASSTIVGRLDGMSDGLYVLSSRVGFPDSFEITQVASAVREGGNLPDELETWLNLPTADPAATIARVSGPRTGVRIAAIAYILPRMAELRTREFSIVASQSEANVERTLLVPRLGERHARVIFVAGPDGFDPGVYRLTLRFIDPVIGREAWTMHVELTPQTGATSDLLDQARRFGTFFSSNVLLGGLPSGAGAVDTRDAPAISSLGATCRGGSRFDAAHRLIGLPVGRDGPADVVVQRLFFGGQTEIVPIRSANLSHQALVVFGHASEPGFASGWYRASTGGGDGITYSFCVGEIGPHGFRVPPAAGSPVEPPHNIIHG